MTLLAFLVLFRFCSVFCLLHVADMTNLLRINSRPKKIRDFKRSFVVDSLLIIWVSKIFAIYVY